MIKLFLVDDSYAIIKALEKILENEDDIKIIGYAKDGKDAIKKIPETKPDVVMLDVEMPGMNGIEVVRYLMRNYPLPILMFSSLTYQGAEVTTQALMGGAVDFIHKPSSWQDIDKIKDEIIEKVKIVSRVKVIRRFDIPKIKARKIFKRIEVKTNKIIVIGSSTGGPRALYALISKLPDGLDCPIVIAQHMPEKFTEILASDLDKISHYRVKEAEDNEQIDNNTIYIGQGGKNVIITKEYKLKMIKDDKPALPSVDILFDSAAKVFQNNVLGIVLTGMGKDGLVGAKKIKANNGIIISESKESAMIYGMPKAVVDEKLADYVSPVYEIPKIIEKIFM